MLTTEQQSYFETFGFIVRRALFSPDEMAIITREFDDAMTEDRGGKPFTGEGQSVGKTVEQRPKLTQLVLDKRILGPIEQLLRQEFIWSGSEAKLTVHPEHRWHADRPGEAELDYMRIKIMIYLDVVTKETGCMRVIPGSHRRPRRP